MGRTEDIVIPDERIMNRTYLIRNYPQPLAPSPNRGKGKEDF